MGELIGWHGCYLIKKVELVIFDNTLTVDLKWKIEM